MGEAIIQVVAAVGVVYLLALLAAIIAEYAWRLIRGK